MSSLGDRGGAVDGARWSAGGAQWLVVSRVPIRTTIKTGGQPGSVSRCGGW